MRFMKSRWRNSLAAKLLGTYIVALVLTTVALAFAMVGSVNWNMEGMTRQTVANDARLLIEHVQFDSTGRPVAVSMPGDMAFLYRALPGEVKYRVLDESGNVVLSSESDVRALAPAGAQFDPARPTFRIDERGSALQVAIASTIKDGHRWYGQVASTERLVRLSQIGASWGILRTTLLTVALSLVVSSAVILFTVIRTLRPLRDASLAASRIAPDNLSARLDPVGLPSELSPLIEAFNLALERIERGYRLQQEFLATAAHELKTPLALIRGQIEFANASDRDNLLKDIDFMARQVQQLLHLAEVSEARNYIFEEIDLAATASDAKHYMDRLAGREYVRLELRTSGCEVKVRADRSAFFMLLKNLIENAIQHSAPGGLVTIDLNSRALAVRDQGRGIAAEHLARVFDRFWRGPERSNVGAGLGLAICREIALAHGWDLSAHSGDRGARFELLFGHARV